MARVAARNATILAGARDLSGRSNSVGLAWTAEAPEVTCFGTTTRERLAGGVTDTELTVDGFYDTAASQVDTVLGALMGTSALWGVFPEGATACKRGREFTGILTNYSTNVAVADAVGISSTVSGCSPILDVRVLASGSLESAGSAAGAGVDYSASTAGSTYSVLRLLANAGAGAQIAASLQDSADDSAWVTLAEYTGASFGGTLVLLTTGSAARYRRFKYNITGSVGIVVSCGSVA